MSLLFWLGGTVDTFSAQIDLHVGTAVHGLGCVDT